MSVILALYPCTRGFGYTILENLTVPLDCGVATLKPYNGLRLLERIEKLMDFYKPIIVLLQEYDYGGKRTRAKKMVENIIAVAERKHIKVYQYTRQQIRDVFETFGAPNKFLIATKIAQAIPELAHRIPRPRKMWLPDDHNAPMFDAISLAFAHNYLTE